MTTHLPLVNKHSKWKKGIYLIIVNIWLTTYPPLFVYVNIEWPLRRITPFKFLKFEIQNLTDFYSLWFKSNRIDTNNESNLWILLTIDSFDLAWNAWLTCKKNYKIRFHTTLMFKKGDQTIKYFRACFKKEYFFLKCLLSN